MASTQETSTSIIKSDRVGRTRYSKAYKAEVIAAFAQHGGVKYPTLASWVAKARHSSIGGGRTADEG